MLPATHHLPCTITVLQIQRLDFIVPETDISADDGHVRGPVVAMNMMEGTAGADPPPSNAVVMG